MENNTSMKWLLYLLTIFTFTFSILAGSKLYLALSIFGLGVALMERAIEQVKKQLENKEDHE